MTKSTLRIKSGSALDRMLRMIAEEVAKEFSVARSTATPKKRRKSQSQSVKSK